MARETELKYSISTASFEALLDADCVGDFALEEAERREIHDVYADTPDGALNAAGFAFRIRHRGDLRFACLKSVGRGSGLGHDREEHETRIDPHESPDRWPEGEAKELFLRITDGRPVETEVEIWQTRVKRLLKSETETVAEVSLDHVRLLNGGQEEMFFELEVELLDHRFVGLLQEVHETLTALYEVTPVGSSKYERAIAFRDASPGFRDGGDEV